VFAADGAEDRNEWRTACLVGKVGIGGLFIPHRRGHIPQQGVLLGQDWGRLRAFADISNDSSS
jgi:hypothetical protein